MEVKGESKDVVASAVKGRAEAPVSIKTKVSLRQILMRKNWNLKTKLVDNEVDIEIETQNGRLFKARCGLGLEGLRYLESEFDKVTGRVSPCSPSEVGITDKWRAQVSGKENYAEIDLWMDQKADEQREAADEYGFLECSWSQEEREISFAEIFSVENYVGKVKVKSDKEGAYLLTLGFHRESSGLYSNIEGDEQVPKIADLVQEYIRDDFVAMVVGRRQLVQGDMTPLQALNLDLNTLGEDGLRAFVYAGGALRSRTARSKIGSLFPTEELSLDDFFAQLVNNVAARGSNYVSGYE